MKRQFTKEEKKISEKSVLRLQEDLEELDFYKSYNRMMLDSGLNVHVKRKREEYQKNFDVAEQEYDAKFKTLQILQDQIRNGVEVKEKKE